MVRFIDPFAALSIWPYAFCRFLQVTITMFIFFQFMFLCFVLMDTLYACAMKSSPQWLYWLAVVLPWSQAIVGYTILGIEGQVAEAWPRAISNGFGALIVIGNCLAYDGCGGYLIFILKRHHRLGGSDSGEPNDSGTKSQDTIVLVIRKTLRSMVLVSVMCIVTFSLLLSSAVGQISGPAVPPWTPDVVPDRSGLQIIFMHLVIELLYIKLGWVTKEQVDAQVAASLSSTRKSLGGTSSGMTRSELTDKARQQSQTFKRSTTALPLEGGVSVSPQTDSAPEAPSPRSMVEIPVLDQKNEDGDGSARNAISPSSDTGIAM